MLGDETQGRAFSRYQSEENGDVNLNKYFISSQPTSRVYSYNFCPCTTTNKIHIFKIIYIHIKYLNTVYFLFYNKYYQI